MLSRSNFSDVLAVNFRKLGFNGVDSHFNAALRGLAIVCVMIIVAEKVDEACCVSWWTRRCSCL